MFREAWERGLKTTYYLRTLNRSGIDNANRKRRAPDLSKREIANAEKMACSLEAVRNGGICDACQ
jgi:ribonucleoside-diphosphate reductase alpha chain